MRKKERNGPGMVIVAGRDSMLLFSDAEEGGGELAARALEGWLAQTDSRIKKGAKR
jgi:hypothetical protein